MAEALAARFEPLLEEAAENRLVHAELLLDGGGGEADLPADAALARGLAQRHEPELDLVRLVERELAAPRRREVDAALVLLPERGHGRGDVELGHGAPQERKRSRRSGSPGATA